MDDLVVGISSIIWKQKCVNELLLHIYFAFPDWEITVKETSLCRDDFIIDMLSIWIQNEINEPYLLDLVFLHAWKMFCRYIVYVDVK